MKKCLILILLFLFIYNIPFVFLPVSTAKFVLVLSLITFFISRKRDYLAPYFSFKTLSPFLLIFVLLFFSAFSNFYNKTKDFTFVYTYILMLLEYLLGAGIIVYLTISLGVEKEKAIIVFFNAFVWICLIQSLLIYLMLFNVSFRDFSFAIINAPDRVDVNERYGGFRGLGYASSVTYDFAVLQSFALMVIPFLSIKEKTTKKFVFYAISYFLIFGTVLISGRTGFIGVFFSIVLLIYHTFKNKNGQTTINNKFGTIVYMAFGLLVSIVVYYFFILDPTTRSYIEDYIFPYAFEMFVNLFNNGSATTKSTDKLSAMYFAIDLKTFFIGDGWYKNPLGDGFYMGTDAGFMRQVLFYGIFGSLVLYLFYAVLLFKVWLKKISRDLKAIFLLLILYMFIVQYKGDIMMGSSFCVKIIFIYYLLLMNKEVNKTLPVNQ